MRNSSRQAFSSASFWRNAASRSPLMWVTTKGWYPSPPFRMSRENVDCPLAAQMRTAQEPASLVQFDIGVGKELDPLRLLLNFGLLLSA